MRSRCTLIIILFLFGASHVFGQVSITGISPGSGPVGTSVVITGSNFSVTASDNKVLLGTIPVSVTQSTATQLTITVPAGATGDFISVVNTHSPTVAISPRPFMVTFDTNGKIDASSFLSPITITDPTGTGSAPTNVLAADIDGDGKVDLLTANLGSIRVFRNISNGTDPISASSFAAPVVFSAAGVEEIAIGDLDCDGKPDLAFTRDTGYKIVIFRNQSTPGEITVTSFGSMKELSTHSDPHGIAIGDVDGDGKPELVTSNWYTDKVSVFKNNTSPGGFDINSFSQRYDFNTADGPMDVALADMDRDGLLDIVTTCKEAYQFSVLHGLSHPGPVNNASFGTHKDYYTDAGPIDLILVDIDKDDRPDVVNTNISSWSITIRMNLAQPGPFDASSFGPRLEYFAISPPQHVASGDFDGDGYFDLVTVNDDVQKSVAVFESSNVPGSPPVNTFFPKIDLSAGAKSNGVAVADFNADGKADIVTCSATAGTLSLFINKSVRVTPPPVVTSFSPTNGNFLDEIVIQGQNFSERTTDNLVKFNGLDARVLNSTSTSLTVEVPFHATSGKISVRVNGFETSTSTDDFTAFQIPTITSFAPASGPVNTSVIIHGTNFSEIKEENIVRFGATRATVTQASADQLTVTVPVGATYEPITVQTHNLTSYSSQPFRVTFDNDNPLNTNSFSSETTLFFQRPLGGAVGDIDDDGKPDVVIFSRTAIAIFRNISTPGSITTNSFAAPNYIFYGTDNDFSSMELKDLDADGKLDIVVVDYAANIRFFKNQSIVGSTSFVFPVTIEVGEEQLVHDVSVADIDGDGRPDLVVGTEHNSGLMDILKNTSIRGKFSIASPVSQQTPGNGFDLTVGDLDGDNKIDIAYPNVSYSKSISVFRNASTQNLIDLHSVDERVDFPTFQFTWDIALGDLDVDGKTDIAAATRVATGGRSISLLRNASSPGAITSASFEPFVNLLIGSEPTSIAVGDLDGDGKPEVVTRYCGSLKCPVTIFKNISTPGTLTTNSFEAGKDITNSSVGGEFITIGDIDGDGKPEIIAGKDNGVSIFQDPEPTEPPPPVSGTTSQSITFNALPTVVYGSSPITLTATATSGLPINYQSTNLAVATIQGNILTITGGGTANIRARQNGNETYSAAAEVTRTLTVDRASQTITFNELPSKVIDDDPFTLTATASSGLTVFYAVDDASIANITNNVVTILDFGTATITASQPGNANYSPATSVTRTLVVDLVLGLGEPFNETNGLWSPNPTEGKVTLTLISSELNKPVVISLFDYFGRQLKQVTFQPNDMFSMDLSGLANGVYLIHVSQGGADHWSKVIKK